MRRLGRNPLDVVRGRVEPSWRGWAQVAPSPSDPILFIAEFHFLPPLMATGFILPAFLLRAIIFYLLCVQVLQSHDLYLKVPAHRYCYSGFVAKQTNALLKVPVGKPLSSVSCGSHPNLVFLLQLLEGECAEVVEDARGRERGGAGVRR